MLSWEWSFQVGHGSGGGTGKHKGLLPAQPAQGLIATASSAQHRAPLPSPQHSSCTQITPCQVMQPQGHGCPLSLWIHSCMGGRTGWCGEEGESSKPFPEPLQPRVLGLRTRHRHSVPLPPPDLAGSIAAGCTAGIVSPQQFMSPTLPISVLLG